MKFLELNKKRHATKHFNEKAVDFKDVRTAIEIAQLAPSAHIISSLGSLLLLKIKRQPWLKTCLL